MKASHRSSYGNEKVIKYGDYQKPKPNKEEILIKVEASSFNRTDDGFLRAKPFIVRLFSGLIKPKAKILGCEFAGKIVEVGESVDNFKINDRVFGFDDDAFGGHGEFIAINQNKMVGLLPDNTDYQTGGIALEGAHYALFYIRESKATKDSRVLVNGGTGAIGSSAIQILKSQNIYVVATAGTKNLEKVKKLGADEVIDYQKVDFTKIDHKFDFVFDAVGKSSFRKCKKLLVDNGIYSSTELGDFGENPILALITKFFGSYQGKRILFPIPSNQKNDLEYISKLLQSGEYKPLFDRQYHVKDIQEAIVYVNSGQKIGNVSIVHSIS